MICNCQRVRNNFISSYEYIRNYLFPSYEYIRNYLFPSYVIPKCNIEKQQNKPPKDHNDLYLYMCSMGDINELRRLFIKYPNLDLNKGLLYSIEANQEFTCAYLIDQGANNLNEALKLAVEKNFRTISELLVKRGADPIHGIRYSKSLNITNMLYEYENKLRLKN